MTTPRAPAAPGREHCGRRERSIEASATKVTAQMATDGDEHTGRTGARQYAERPPLRPSERNARNRRSAAAQQRITRTWLRELARSASGERGRTA
jgi:hypothetical protein